MQTQYIQKHECQCTNMPINFFFKYWLNICIYKKCMLRKCVWGRRGAAILFNFIGISFHLTHSEHHCEFRKTGHSPFTIRYSLKIIYLIDLKLFVLCSTESSGGESLYLPQTRTMYLSGMKYRMTVNTQRATMASQLKNGIVQLNILNEKLIDQKYNSSQEKN